MRQSYRIFPLIIMVLLLISGIPLLVDSNVEGGITPTRGITITVDQSGGGDYTIIQNAVDNATDGDKIIIGPGLYFENIFVDKELEIVGAGDDRTILEGDETNTAFQFLSRGINISQIKINNSYFGVHIDRNANNITIINCVFDNIRGYGIYSSDISEICDILVFNNLFTNTYRGIIMRPSLKRISIISNILMDIEGYGIIFSSTNTIIKNNNILRIGMAGISQHWGSAEISNNYISNCDIGYKITQHRPNGTVFISDNYIINGRTGIHFRYSYYPDRTIYMDNNTINNMTEYGVYSDGPLYYLTNSEISNCGIAGIYNAGGYAHITGNIIRDSKDGLYGDHRGFWSINNTITNNSGYGIFISYASKLYLIGNIISGNGFGLKFKECEEYTISGNYFINNTVQANQEGDGINKWYLDYPIGGNHWSDHTGKDVKRGAQQALWGSDGFVDNPYTITGGGWDSYPIFVDTVDPVVQNMSDATIDPGTIFHFDCTESWDDQIVTSALWEFVYDDIPRSIAHLEFDFQFNTTGVYPVNLTVYDYYGNSDRTSFIITVLDSTAPVPMVDNSTIYYQGDTVTFNGSGSYDNAGIVNWTWKFYYEGEEQLLYGEIAHFTFIVPGYYDCTLFVSDEAGHTASLDFILTVTDTEKPISYAGQNLTIENGEMVAFDGGGSTDNLMIENFTWSFEYDDEVVYLYGALHSFYFMIPDIYYVNLTVRDTFGNEDSHIMTLNVLDTHDPVARINGSRNILPGEHIVLDGSRSTDNGKIVRYLWTFDDEGPVMIEGPLLSYLANRTGVMVITLSVWDDSGRLNQTWTTITFLDTNEPTAVAPGDSSIPVGRTFKFVGIYSTDDGVIVKYQWDLVYDLVETTLFGATVNFTFDIPGTYPITLTVYDQSGNTGETTFIIAVKDTGNFEGAVFADEERRIPGATVILTDINGNEHTTETDSEGKFVFTDIPMGTAHYKVIKNGYEVFEGEIKIEPGATICTDSSVIVLVGEENGKDASPNYYVIFGLILLVLIIISGVIIMFIRFARNIKDEEAPPPEEDEPITSQETVEEEIPSSPMEEDTIPDDSFMEPQVDPLTTLQEDPFGEYDLPQDQAEQIVEPPAEIEVEPVEDIPQEEISEPLQEPDPEPEPVS